MNDSLEMGSLLAEQQQHTLQQDEFLPRCSCRRDAEVTFREGPLSQSPDREGLCSFPGVKVNGGTTFTRRLQRLSSKWPQQKHKQLSDRRDFCAENSLPLPNGPGKKTSGERCTVPALPRPWAQCSNRDPSVFVQADSRHPASYSRPTPSETVP